MTIKSLTERALTPKFQKDVIELRSFGNDVREAIVRDATQMTTAYLEAQHRYPWIYGELFRLQRKYMHCMQRFSACHQLRKKRHHADQGSKWMDKLAPLDRLTRAIEDELKGQRA